MADGEPVTALSDQAPDFRRLEQRRGAASEKDGIHRLVPAGRRNFALESRDVAVFEPGFEQAAIEIAVIADGRAEGNVDVEAQHGVLSAEMSNVEYCWEDGTPESTAGFTARPPEVSSFGLGLFQLCTNRPFGSRGKGAAARRTLPQHDQIVDAAVRWQVTIVRA